MWVWSITLVELALRFGHVPDRCFMMSLGRGIQSLVWLTFWNYVSVTFWSRIFHLVDTIDHVLSPHFGQTHLRFRTYVFVCCVLRPLTKICYPTNEAHKQYNLSDTICNRIFSFGAPGNDLTLSPPNLLHVGRRSRLTRSWFSWFCYECFPGGRK